MNFKMLKTTNFDEGGYSMMVYSEKIGNNYVTEINQPSLIHRVNQLGTSFRCSNYRGRASVLTSDDKNSRSKSLNDLTEYQHAEERGNYYVKKNLERLTAVPVQQSNYLYRTEPGIEKEAGRCILRALIINAWRCRRRDSEEAAEIVGNLTNQVESLNMQIYVLKQLLENEKIKREGAAKEVQSNLLKIEEFERENKITLEEKEMLEIKLKELLDTVIELKDECENQKNNFRTAKMEAETWEMKFNQEKKKSKSLIEENKILQKDCKAKDERLMNQKRLSNEAWLQVRSGEEKLQLSEKFRMEQKVLLTVRDEKINELKAQIALKEEKLRQQDERNGDLGKLLSDKTKELAVADEKLRELTKAQKFWGNRVIKIASICTRIPIACFYTVATLLLPQPSNRMF